MIMRWIQPMVRTGIYKLPPMIMMMIIMSESCSPLLVNMGVYVGFVNGDELAKKAPTLIAPDKLLHARTVLLDIFFHVGAA